MLSGGPHQLTKDKFVLAKIPSNVHMQNEEVKLDESLYTCWHFLEGQYFTPTKTRCFGQITKSLPSSSSKPTRASISSLSEATHDCVVCSSLKCAFTSLTQEFKGKNCLRSGYLVDTSHSLVQFTAKEHENCDIIFNERPFHLCILYL